MSHAIEGRCHCGNLSYELVTDVPLEEIRVRACDCSFCRSLGAKNWSDARGTTTIRVRDPDQLQRYAFALRTCEFFLCRNCGGYAAAVLSDEGGTWSTINLRLSKLHDAEAGPISYASEDTAARIERRKRVWTPTTVILGAN